MRSMKSLQRAAVAPVVLAVTSFGTGSPADPVPSGWEANNMEPIGYSRLENRKGAFKMAIKKVNGRWYLYMGHLWHYGWSIVDVTDPREPKFLKTVPGPGNTWTIQMTLHDNIMITALEKSSLAWGADPNKPNEEGVLIWDISDPVNPRQLSHWKTGATGTHRNSYPGGKYAYFVGGRAGLQLEYSRDSRHQRSGASEGGWSLVDAGTKGGRGQTGGAGGISWTGQYQPGRQDGIYGLFAGSGESRH